MNGHIEANVYTLLESAIPILCQLIPVEWNTEIHLYLIIPHYTFERVHIVNSNLDTRLLLVQVTKVFIYLFKWSS